MTDEPGAARHLTRSRKDIRGRLRRAAFELYSERGYDRTTTAEIAERAGVTERTFFRHFPDKREVVFDGETDMLAALTAAVAAAPDALGPMEVLLWTTRSFEKTLEENRPINERWQKIISQTPALRERQVAKAAAMIAALAAALERRGVEERLASLTASAGMAVLDHATRAWFANPSTSLSTHFQRELHALHRLSAAG